MAQSGYVEYNVTLTTVVKFEEQEEQDFEAAVQEEVAGGFFVIRKVEEIEKPRTVHSDALGPVSIPED